MIPPGEMMAFVAVCEMGSMRAAAGRLNLTQSAVSQSIQRLESILGLPLLDRSRYRAQPTPQGRLLFDRMAALIRQSEELKTFSRVLSAGVEERVRIAVQSAAPPELWSHIAAAAASRFPDTVIEIRAGAADQPLDDLTSGEAQLAVVVDPILRAERGGVEHRELGRLDFVNVIRAGLAQEPAGGPPRVPQILVSNFRDADTRSYAVMRGARHWRVSDYGVKLHLILQGLGWGLLPDGLASPHLETGRLERLKVGEIVEAAQSAVRLCRLRGGARGPVAEALWSAAGAAD
jgi:DNA-binding transcriptional LysR family regulator